MSFPQIALRWKGTIDLGLASGWDWLGILNTVLIRIEPVIIGVTRFILEKFLCCKLAQPIFGQVVKNMNEEFYRDGLQHIQRASTYDQQGEYPMALEEYNKAIRLMDNLIPGVLHLVLF
jgi:hypothetical protein